MIDTSPRCRRTARIALVLLALFTAAMLAATPAHAFSLSGERFVKSLDAAGNTLEAAEEAERQNKTVAEQIVDEQIDRTAGRAADAIEKGAARAAKNSWDTLVKSKSKIGVFARRAATRWGPAAANGLRLASPVGKVVGAWQAGYTVGTFIGERVTAPLIDRYFDEKSAELEEQLRRNVAETRERGEFRRKLDDDIAAYERAARAEDEEERRRQEARLNLERQRARFSVRAVSNAGAAEGGAAPASADGNAVGMGIDGFTFSCRVPIVGMVVPDDGAFGSFSYSDIRAQRQGCLDDVNRAISLCRSNALRLPALDLADRELDRCHSSLKEQRQQCVMHFARQRIRCNAGGAERPREADLEPLGHDRREADEARDRHERRLHEERMQTLQERDRAIRQRERRDAVWHAEQRDAVGDRERDGLAWDEEQRDALREHERDGLAWDREHRDALRERERDGLAWDRERRDALRERERDNLAWEEEKRERDALRERELAKKEQRERDALIKRRLREDKQLERDIAENEEYWGVVIGPQRLPSGYDSCDEYCGSIQ